MIYPTSWFKQNLAGYHLDWPAGIAAGVMKSVKDAKRAAQSSAAFVTMGSYTPERRDGNPGRTFAMTRNGSLNSLGIPNEGRKWLAANFGEIVQIFNDAGKLVICSVAAFDAPNFGVMAATAAECKAPIIELNFGCPNLWTEGKQKPIASFNPEYMQEILYFVRKEVGINQVIAIKASPFSDPSQLPAFDDVMAANSDLVNIVVACNTIPNAMAFDDRGRQDGQPVTTPADGLAGAAGYGFHDFAVGQVYQHRENLPPEIQIIGVGGVSEANDVIDFMRVGATAVGLATHIYWNKEESFSYLQMSYADKVHTWP